MIQEQKEWLHLPQQTVNERLKFLISFYDISARTLSREIGVADTNTQNYIGPRQADPGAAYLEKLLFRFSQIDAYWLLTGDGEPFVDVPHTDEDAHDDPSDLEIYRLHKSGTPIPTSKAQESKPSYQKNKKISRSLVTNKVGRDAIQNHGVSGNEQALQREIELLKQQVADKERTIQILLSK